MSSDSNRDEPQPTQTPRGPASSDETQASPAPGQVANASPAEIVRFVSAIKNVEQQVGEHIIQALQHADTVAVLTSVVAGPGGQQHIVSAALNLAQAAQVNALLKTAAEERIDEEMCVGFHCLVKPKPG